MLTRERLCHQRCVQGLIEILEQVHVRAAARSPLVLDADSVSLLLFWTLLRGERTFLLRTLEEIGVDMWALTCQLDAVLNERKTGEGQVAATGSFTLAFHVAVDHYVEIWLDCAKAQANLLGHNYVGTEHLLLAILARPDASQASLLEPHGLDYARVRGAIVARLAQSPLVTPVVTAEVIAEVPAQPMGPWGARWDTPAAGVPRRFGMAVLMLLMTMYAVLFAAMKLLNAEVTYFLIVAVLATGVGLGQMLLFGGRYPRAASIWVGMCLFPLEAVVAYLIAFLGSAHSGIERFEVVVLAILMAVPMAAVGALFGYLMGGLTAGVFLLIDRFAKNTAPEPAADEDPFGKPD